MQPFLLITNTGEDLHNKVNLLYRDGREKEKNILVSKTTRFLHSIHSSMYWISYCKSHLGRHGTEVE